jgi:hypothetical protein
MAENDKSFPKVTEAGWWKLRDLFKRRVPTNVTGSYLASALTMNEKSAKANIIGPLKKIGIIGDDGKPTDLAYDWRDDSKYPEVCKTILEKFYPQEVRDLYHDANQDLSGLATWFMNYARCGEVTARMYAAFYRLLLRADPNEQTAALAQPTASKTTTPKLKNKFESPKKAKEITVSTKGDDGNIQASPSKNKSEQGDMFHLASTPQLHINIQLHISPETTADQIDKIFESMARHLKSMSTIVE